MARSLYVIAYDVTDQYRLAQVREFLKGYSTGGQKSVYECFLTDGELKEVASHLGSLIDHREDRLHVFSLDGRSRTHTLGIALQPNDPEFLFIG
ncbi:MAG TPA: CRISPR-associated endonuclease Cas2 [Dissulfurispiraceae bacterium]|nr:CRISPR-associated endonuclease Cas2 [Dissulfurispiraceae bacterium]